MHDGYGYFMRLDLVGNNLRSVPKSKSSCYPVIITSLPTRCYPTFEKTLYFFLRFFNWLSIIFTVTLWRT